MAGGKKGFVLYADMITMVEKLPNDKAGELFKFILDYVNDKNPETDDLLLQIAFDPIKNSLKRDLEKYETRCARNKANGVKGGRPNKNPKEPTGLNGLKNKPKKADSDKERDSDIDKERDSDTDKEIKSLNNKNSNPLTNPIPLSNRQTEMKEHLLSQQIWIEQVSMKMGFKAEIKLLEFLDEQILSDGLLRPERAIKNYFINWIKKQPKEEQKEESFLDKYHREAKEKEALKNNT